MDRRMTVFLPSFLYIINASVSINVSVPVPTIQRMKQATNLCIFFNDGINHSLISNNYRIYFLCLPFFIVSRPTFPAVGWQENSSAVWQRLTFQVIHEWAGSIRTPALALPSVISPMTKWRLMNRHGGFWKLWVMWQTRQVRIMISFSDPFS